MKLDNSLIFFICILIIFAGITTVFCFAKIGTLQDEISVLESSHAVELITAADSIKSAEFARYAAQLKAKDSIYSVQLIMLQNENARLKTDYRRLHDDYSAIAIDRPAW